MVTKTGYKKRLDGRNKIIIRAPQVSLYEVRSIKYSRSLCTKYILRSSYIICQYPRERHERAVCGIPPSRITCLQRNTTKKEHILRGIYMYVHPEDKAKKGEKERTRENGTATIIAVAMNGIHFTLENVSCEIFSFFRKVILFIIFVLIKLRVVIRSRVPCMIPGSMISYRI